MSDTKTTSEGYSYHTQELKVNLDSERFDEALEYSYEAARKSKDSHTYPLKKYQSKSSKPHCSTILSHHGIKLFFTESIKTDDWHNYTVKAVVNPRKVLDPECSYLGIAPTDEESLERFQDEFTILMRQCHLPESLDEWTQSRPDLCVNLQLDKKKSAREFCRLLQKDPTPPKMERAFFFDPDADKELRKKQKEADKHSICLKNSSYAIVVYDKLFQAGTEGLSGFWCDLPDSILRLELCCFKPYLKKLAKKEKLDSTSEQLYWMVRHSRELILKKAGQMFSSGMHYKPAAAKQIIDQSSYHEVTREQLKWLVDRTRYSFNFRQLEKGMAKNFDLQPRTVAKRLEQLEDLGINLVPLRKDFYLEQLPSLPKILESLEDDSSSFKLTSNGEIEW